MSTSPRDTPTLSGWMELDYFKRPSPFRRLWLWSVLAALAVAVVAGAAWSFLPGQKKALQAGPLSTAHASFNQDCAICHQESFQTLHRLLTLDPSVHAVSDANCSQCHAGPKHHEVQARTDNCARCHREHRGQAVLARVPDEFCLDCHRHLAQSTVRSLIPQYEDVPSWDRHPDFVKRWVGQAKDPGTITFSHQAHLNPKGVYVLDNQQLAQVWGPNAQAIQGVRGIKHLQCRDCHQPDEAGRFMKPVTFEEHCKACHPLSVQVVTSVQAEELEPFLKEFALRSVPHREPGVVRGAIHQQLVDFIHQPKLSADLKTQLLGAPAEPTPRPIPGMLKSQPLNRPEYEWVNQETKTIEDVLFQKPGGCRYCHQPSAKAAMAQDGLPNYLPSQINQRTFTLQTDDANDRKESSFTSPQWFPHSRFEHFSHRLVECADCHKGIRDSDEKDLMPHLPDVKSCQTCHQSGTGAMARSDCVECHTYHPAAKKWDDAQWTFETGTPAHKKSPISSPHP